ncbi:MAG: T9SS type A sorting domain-containing protein [Bacteroidota bacterium]|nr:T9SS type A sorting domain-containing protein [Bacteroidota bacterium]
MKKSLLITICFSAFNAFAQSTSFQIPCAGASSPAVASQDWNPTVAVIEHTNPAKDLRKEIKDSLAAIYRTGGSAAPQNAQRSSAVAPAAPVIGLNFLGNGFNSGTPNDNEIAIGNNGQLISVQNSNIFRRNTVTATNLGTQSLTSWCSVLGNNGSKYDPKVLYDPEANRFILICLAGYLSNNTNIIIGFSRTDSANGLYNLYSVPGNPFNDTLWSDYPMMAVNRDELFLTVNLLHDNQSWQTGFVQTVIWQLNKWDGYAGDTLNTELHNNITFGSRPIRNLCPVEGGGYPDAGPGMYFLSDRNLAASNDTVFLVHVSDTANAVGNSISVTALTSGTSYFMPPNARTPGNDGDLATNDARILGAFIQNDIIQFVNNTMDTSTGSCAVYHGKITNASSAPSFTASIFGDTSLEFGYPNIAWVGQTASDNSAIIFFLHSDSITFPGTSAIVTDGNGLYSPRTVVRAGQGYIDVLNGDERWGDYTGIQRKYDAGGTCWVNGMYGLPNHLHATWVAQIGITSDVSVQPVTENVSEISAYPNPFANSFSIVFTNAKVQPVRFALYDMNGRLVKILLEDKVGEGKVKFGFSPGPLASGVYLLRAEAADGSVLFTQRIIQQ